jgi:hypothetical protein
MKCKVEHKTNTPNDKIHILIWNFLPIMYTVLISKQNLVNKFSTLNIVQNPKMIWKTII